MKCQYFLKNSEFIECKGEECPLRTQDMACQHTIITLTVYEKEDGGRVLEIKK